MCRFEVTFLLLFICCLGDNRSVGWGKSCSWKKKQANLIVGDENEEHWKILLLATVKVIIKGINCSRDKENMMWLVGFIIREELSYLLFL